MQPVSEHVAAVQKTVTVAQVRLSQLRTATAKATETATVTPNGANTGWNVQSSFRNEYASG